MEYVIFFAVILVVFAVMFLYGYMDDRKRREQLIKKLRENYGDKPFTNVTDEEMVNIKKMFYRFEDDNSIDDITAGDIDLDSLFKRMNYTRSNMGASVLYYTLRNPKSDDSLDELENKVTFFSEHEKERLELLGFFSGIGKMKADIFECLDYFDEIPVRNLFKDFLAIILILISIGVIFVSPQAGIFLIIITICYNILTYYSARGMIENSIVAYGYINRFINISKHILKEKTDCLSEEFAEIEENVDKLKDFSKHANFVINNNSSKIGSGNPLDMLMDYTKMFLHLDIIYFYRMLKALRQNKESVEKLYFSLGLIETYISIAYFRAGLREYCVPEKGDNLTIDNLYHPLIDNPVVNSIQADRGVLITGSNASGKSTFLKSVAINVLFAQTIHTCTASGYKGDYYSLFSSMSLRDDLSGKDSYFMVEIKAMKRILDFKTKNPEKKVLCFVDEVLRGTNTVERIAASTQILKYLSDKKCICFAATHDGELTFLLENEYDNYHFEEKIQDGDVLFNYILQKGRATTRNAIKLLDVMGFPDELVDKAESLAEKFIEKGVWI